MRSATRFAPVLALLLAAAPMVGCDRLETDDDSGDAVATTTAALESEADGQALGTLAFPRALAFRVPPATAQERVDAVKAYIDEHLSCAQATASATGLDITFSTDCAWAGQRWTGDISISYAADGSSASLTMSGLKVDGATMTGTMEITRHAQGHVSVAADWETIRASGRVVNGSWQAEYTWDEEAYTVVHASHELDVDGTTATLTKDGVRWLRGDYAPEAGTVTFAGFRGRTWSLVYGRDADGFITITLTNGSGRTRTYTLDAQGYPQRTT